MPRSVGASTLLSSIGVTVAASVWEPAPTPGRRQLAAAARDQIGGRERPRRSGLQVHASVRRRDPERPAVGGPVAPCARLVGEPAALALRVVGLEGIVEPA